MASCGEALKQRKAAFLLFILQIIFAILFGLFARYDDDSDARFYPAEDKNDYPIRYSLFQDVHIMIFIGFGFLMTFLCRYSYSAVGFNFLLASVAIQWSIIIQGFFHIEQEGRKQGHFLINAKSLIQGDFAAGAVLISFGVLLGKTGPFQLCLMTLIEIVFYAVNVFICEEKLHLSDAGGSILIHTFGAYFGLACSLVMRKKWHFDHPKNKPAYDHDLFSMIGTVFLWICWPTFNGALLDNYDQQHRVAINTYFSLAACVLMTFATAISVGEKGKLAMDLVQNATLAGGVAVGTTANFMIQPLGAILIGSIAGVLSVLGFKFISPFLENKLRLHDTCGVHNLHGMPGVLAALAGVIAASLASPASYGKGLQDVFPSRSYQVPKNLTLGQYLETESPETSRSAATQTGIQAASLGITLALAIIGGCLTGAIFKFLEEEDEESGFEDQKHWELPDEGSQEKETNKDATNGYRETEIRQRQPQAQIETRFDHATNNQH